MAAGCLVLSVPVLGGMDYLRDGDNCLVADPGEMPERLRWIAAPENARLRERIRHRARATAGPYRSVGPAPATEPIAPFGIRRTADVNSPGITAIIISRGLETLLRFCLETLSRELSGIGSDREHRIVLVDNASPFPYNPADYHLQPVG